MVKVKLVKRVDLSGFGEDWKDCYVEITAPTYKDVRKITSFGSEDQDKAINNGISTLKDLFIKGTVNTENGHVDITKDEIEDLPLQILTKCFKEMSGQPDPK